MALIELNKNGIYCAEADVYIDPWRSVDKALITHGHSDHSRPGHKSYLCTHASVPIIKHRLGSKINIAGIGYGESIMVNGVKFSFHPAGHIIGSAQIRAEGKGEVWVISGDYKTENDGISGCFEPVNCTHFITESTFGLPVYKWKKQSKVFDEINNWWSLNKSLGKTTIITAYSLGKAQRILHNIDSEIGKIFCHGAIAKMNNAIRNSGIPLKDTLLIEKESKPQDFAGHLIIAPPSALGSSWMKRFKNVSVGIASGWMMLRGARRRRGADRGFVLSDHCDWDGLNESIKATGAENIYPTHGYTQIYSRWLREQGYNAQPLETEFEGESLEKKEE